MQRCQWFTGLFLLCALSILTPPMISDAQAAKKQTQAEQRKAKYVAAMRASQAEAQAKKRRTATNNPVPMTPGMAAQMRAKRRAIEAQRTPNTIPAVAATATAAALAAAATAAVQAALPTPAIDAATAPVPNSQFADKPLPQAVLTTSPNAIPPARPARPQMGLFAPPAIAAPASAMNAETTPANSLSEANVAATATPQTAAAPIKDAYQPNRSNWGGIGGVGGLGRVGGSGNR